MTQRIWTPLLLALLVSLTGCIGTDLIDDLVEEAGEARIEVTPDEAALLVGTTTSLSATYYDATGGAVPSVTFDWTTSDPAVATVDGSGTVAAVAPGQVAVQAFAQDVSSPSTMVTVVADPNQVARVDVLPDTVALDQGQVQQYTAAAFNLLGDEVTGNPVMWAVADDAVAEIDADGLATAKDAGVTQVTATVDGVASVPVELRVRGQIRTGTFSPADGTNYTVAGTAVLEERAGGGLILRFEEDFAVSNGPGLEVILSPSNGVTATSINLGRLKNTSGEQSYVATGDLNIDTYKWVVIHCVPFNVSFGSAPLSR